MKQNIPKVIENLLALSQKPKSRALIDDWAHDIKTVQRPRVPVIRDGDSSIWMGEGWSHFCPLQWSEITNTS